MYRRHFFQTAGLAAGALAAGQVHAGQFTGKIKKAVKFQMIQEDLSVLDKFKLLKDLGFDGTEISTRDKSIDPAEVETAIEKTGIPVHGVVHSSNPDIESGVDLARRFGGNSVLCVCRYDRKMPLQENWDRDVKNLRAAAPYAEKHGVKLLVENVWASYLISAFDVKHFLEEIDHPAVGSYFDVGNNVRWGVPEHWVQLLGNRIGKLDIKEYDDKKHMNEGLRAGFQTELGEGSVNWEAVRNELAAIGFEGWGTAEVRGGNRERLADIARRMDQVLDL